MMDKQTDEAMYTSQRIAALTARIDILVRSWNLGDEYQSLCDELRELKVGQDANQDSRPGH